MNRLETSTAKRRRGAGLAVVALAALQAVACATVARGTAATQSVIVTSTPAGAQVFLGSQPLGATPATLSLKRRDSHIVLRLEKEGYVPHRLPVTRSLSGWMAFDLFPLNPYIEQGMSSSGHITRGHRALGVALAFGTDFLTGAAYTLPAALHVALTAVRPVPPSDAR